MLLTTVFQADECMNEFIIIVVSVFPVRAAGSFSVTTGHAIFVCGLMKLYITLLPWMSYNLDDSQ